MKSDDSPQSKWQIGASELARRFNWAWFLEQLSIPLLGSGLLGACLILAARRELTEFPWSIAALVTTSILALITLSAWLIARKKFTTRESTLVRIESSMSLNNSLTAANHGLTTWPEYKQTIHDGTRWNWTRLLIPPTATLLLLLLAFFLPLSAKSDPNAPPPEEPANRANLQASIDQLREDNTINEEYLQEVQKKLDELRDKPAEEWFDHASLEATDNLKRTHEQELKKTERDLRKAERALNALQNHQKNMGQSTRERLLNEFDQALENMGNSAMKPNPELLKQLGNLDPNQLNNLSQKQLDQLRENMRQHAQQMNDANGNGGAQNEEWLDELMQEGADPG
ncbi:MAG: hypothetical protein AAGC74_00865 [Verrucomicrobiota bacterium]